MIKKSTFYRFIVTFVLTVIAILLLKNNNVLKTQFYKYVYNDTISFASINAWYQKKFGSPIPFQDYFKIDPVFQEKLTYHEASLYKDGVRLKVDDPYLVPALDSGIVIFIGEKEGYGNTIIIEHASGLTVWYSNMTQINLKMYDYVTQGSFLGEAKGTLYLVFYKDGEVIDYKEYI